MSKDFKDDDDEDMEIEIYFEEDEEDEDEEMRGYDLDFVDMETVELEYAWNCPKCKKLNFLRHYELGDYECGFCEHEVTIVTKTLETKQ